MQTTKFDVFLSHNSADKPAVEEIARRLVKEGIEPWLDKWNLISGDPWQVAIEEALANCATCAVFIGPSGIGPWHNEEMRAAISRRVSESQGSFRVIPVLLPGATREERSKLPTFLVTTMWVEFQQTLDDEETFRRLICGIRRIAPGPGIGEAVYEGVCPYRGLQVFDVEHAPFFFGREALTEWLLNEFQPQKTPGVSQTPGVFSNKENRFLGIIGASGSGKSSLARAGLMAALKQGKLPGSDSWPIAILRPGINPLESLAVALANVKTMTLSEVSQLQEDCAKREHLLHLTTRLALQNMPPDRRVVILVDQFEEVFTLCQNETLRKGLIDNLIYAATIPEGKTVVVLTLRADFYGKCAAYPALSAALSDHPFLVGGMSAEELRLAIERPAQLAGCEFEAGLVDVLLKDMQDQAGGLPLLQYALLELWNQRTGRRLTLSAYNAIGGVEGALEQRAEAIFERFSETEKQLCRQVFLRLTQTGEDTEATKRRVAMDELTPAQETVVQRLSGEEARLVTVDKLTNPLLGGAGVGTIEVGHEALIRSWKRLKGWLDEDKEFLLWRQRLRASVEEWQRTGHDEGALLRGGLLAEAERWLQERPVDVSADEQQLIQASVDLRQRERAAKERARRRNIMALATGLLIAITLSIVAGIFWYRSEESRKRAEQEQQKAQEQRQIAEQERQKVEEQRDIARSRQLAMQADARLNDQLDLALLLSAESCRISQTVEAQNALLTSLLYKPHLLTFLHSHPGYSVAFSPDGKLLASGSVDNTIILWNVETDQPIGTPLTGHTGSVYSVTFSPDSTWLASGSADKTIILWDVETNQPIGTPLINHTDGVTSVVFSPDGTRLASGSMDKTILLWDIGMRQPIGTPLTGHTSDVTSVVFSPDGTRLASGSADKTIILWDVKTRQPLGMPLTGHTDGVTSVAFSPDGTRLASGSYDETIRLWDIKVGQPIGKPLIDHTGFVYSVAFSPDGKRLASGSGDTTIILWDIEAGQMIGTSLTGHTGSVYSVAFSPDGRRLASGSEDKTIILWDIETRQPLGTPITGHTSTVQSIAFSPDGKRLASGSRDTTIRLWDVKTDQLIGTALIGHTDGVISIAFSSDGMRLASGSVDNTIKLWDIETGQPIGMSLTSHTDVVWSIAFSPDGMRLASGSADKTIILWDIETDQPIGTPLTGHTDGVRSVAFSPDGTRLASGSYDETIRLWDVKTGQPIGKPLTGHTDRVQSVAFSPDGERLASGSVDMTILLWSVETEQPIGQPLTGHTSTVQSITFSPDGKRLASGSQDQTIRLWDVATGQPIGTPFTGHTDGVFSVAFSPDGERLASGSRDKTIILWDINLASWQRRACKMANRNLTVQEWQHYFPGEPYRMVCPDLPIHPSVFEQGGEQGKR